MIYVRTLGTAEIEAGEVRLTPSAAKKYALMLHLCAEPGRRVTRRQLHDLLFPALSEKNARHTLRELVYQLKQAGVEDLVTDDEGIAVRAEAVRSDYSEVIAAERPDVSQLRAIEGGFLPGYAPAHSETYAEWFEGFRSRASLDLCRRLRVEIERSRAVADWTTAEQAARACLAIDALNETATFALAEAYAVTGSKAKAVELLDAYISDVGGRDTQIQLPATLLRKRISEKVSERYASNSEVAFVGREVEMRAVRQAFLRARSGRTSMLLISGEPGIGKTRLVSSFLDLALLDGARVHRAAAHSHDARRPMGAFVDLLPALLQEQGAAGCSPESLSALHRLMARDFDAASAWAVDPEKLSFSIEAGIIDLLDAISAEGTLVVVFEDAHWLDSASLRMLLHMLRRRPNTSLLIVATTRDPEIIVPDDIPRDQFIHVALKPFTPAECTTFCRRTLPESQDDSGLQEWIASFSGGNPLYAFMLADHYRTTGRRFEIPTTLVELIYQRFGRLSINAEAALGCCVALGRHSSIDRLQRSLELPHILVYQALRELETHSLISSNDSAIVPRHPLIAEAMQSDPLSPTHRLTSLRVARVLETDAELVNDPSMLWDCARQWVSAGEHAPAIAALRRCAAHSLNIGRPREAAEFLLEAADLARVSDDRIALLKESIRAAGSAHESHFVLKVIDALRQLSPASGHDDIELFELTALASTYHRGDDFAARALRCVACDTATSDHRVRAGLALLKFANIQSRDDLIATVSSIDLSRHLDSVDEGLALEFGMILETHRSNYACAAEHAERLVALARRTDGPKADPWLFNASLALWRAGKAALSVHIAEEVYQRAKRYDSHRLRTMSAVQLAGTLYDLDEAEASAAWLQHADELSQHVRPRVCEFELLIAKCDVALAEGRIPELVEFLRYAEHSGLSTRSTAARFRRCFELWTRQYGYGPPVAEHEIREIYALRESPSLITAGADVEMAAALRYFSARGQIAEGRAMLIQYLEGFGTIRCPLSRILRLEMERLGFSELTARYYPAITKYRREVGTTPRPT